MGRKVEDKERNAEVGQRGEPRALLESTRSGVTYRVRLKQTLRVNHKAGARDANWGNWEHEKYTNSNVCDCVNTRAAPKWHGVRPPAPVIKTTRYAAVSFVCARPQLSTLPLFFPASHFSCQHKHGETRSRARTLPPPEEARGGPGPYPEQRAGLFYHADRPIVPSQQEEQKRIALESSRGAFKSFGELYPPRAAPRLQSSR